IAYEWPVSWVRVLDPMTDAILESFHVHGYRTQHLRALGEQPFYKVREGGNPPDVLVDTADGTLGLECTRLTIESRQFANALFRALRQHIAAVPPEDFAALTGHLIYIWFNDEGSLLTGPHPRSDAAAIEALVRALVEYRPSGQDLWVPEGPSQGPR